MQAQPQRRNVARNVAIVAGAYILSNLAGFGARLIIAANFDRDATDAFWTAFRIPDLLFMLLAGGALASAFIPTYAGRLAQNEYAAAWALARRVALLVFLVMLGVAALAALFAPWLIQTLVAPQFPADKAALTASLMRLMLISTVIFSVSGLLMGLLQSNGSFLAPALAPALYQLGLVFGATVLSRFGIYGVAAGVVIGALLHLGVQLPALAKINLKTRNTTSTPIPLPHSPLQSDVGQGDLGQILRLMPPRIAGSGAVEINRIVNSNLASGMGAGAPSAMSNAWAIFILPQAVIGQAISTVLFPSISMQAAKGDTAAFAQGLTRALNVVVLLSMPAMAGLIVLGQPLIRVLFQRGQFDATDTAQVAFALAWFAVGLVAHAALELVTRAFYALKDSRTPALFSVVSVAINVPLSLLLSGAFAARGWMPFGGLALALSLSTIIETLVLFVILSRRAPDLRAKSIAVTFAKSAIAAGAMALLLLGLRSVGGDSLLVTAAAIVLGALVYFGLMWLLRSEEARFVVGLVGGRLRRSS